MGLKPHASIAKPKWAIELVEQSMGLKPHASIAKPKWAIEFVEFREDKGIALPIPS
jgi:hypothetical protein